MADDWWFLLDHLLGSTCPHDHSSMCPSQGAVLLFFDTLLLTQFIAPMMYLLSFSAFRKSSTLATLSTRWTIYHGFALFLGLLNMDVFFLPDKNHSGISLSPPTTFSTEKLWWNNLVLSSTGFVSNQTNGILRPFPGGFSPIPCSLPPVDLLLSLYPGLRLVRSFPREEVLPPPGEELFRSFPSSALSFLILTGFISCSSPSLPGPMWPCSVWSPRAT